MKLILSLIVLCFFSCCAFAQQEKVATNSKYYVGASLSNISYMIIKDQSKESGSFSPVVFLNAGYQLNKRIILQAGIGYGQNKFDGGSIYYKSTDSTIYYNDYRRTRGIAIPLTLRFTPFNPNKRLQLHGTASIVPAFGTIKAYRTEEMDGIKTTTYDADVSEFNLIGTAGLMVNYRLSERFDGYIEGNLIYKNFSGSSNYANSRPRSEGLGLNYKLK
ncbi:outer membrane beta-barrel protein [Pontibacter sp. JH31]|uniref:Outer membrane beta-barrel protein n=1 Tax=Pontibacter aquaedesilientis TaxID=2766980 RepID=A0ABR7XGT9_9BACT|nr:outer membrane beta-barrel protein [Pontibacter aquaedesilientis]MBD1397519.1 outer membrane beta-barrel protein [Pontibacter aquaedesilientis]